MRTVYRESIGVHFLYSAQDLRTNCPVKVVNMKPPGTAHCHSCVTSSYM